MKKRINYIFSLCEFRIRFFKVLLCSVFYCYYSVVYQTLFRLLFYTIEDF